MSMYPEVEHSLGGSKDKDKPKKEIHHIEIHHSGTKGDHIVTHHHTHPDHHPSEKHTTRGDDEMVQKAMATMGTPNPGEAAPDPNAAAAAPDPNAAAGAPSAGGPPAAAPTGGM